MASASLEFPFIFTSAVGRDTQWIPEALITPAFTLCPIVCYFHRPPQALASSHGGPQHSTHVLPRVLLALPVAVCAGSGV